MPHNTGKPVPYKWARCLCPFCHVIHEDVVPVHTPTVHLGPHGRVCRASCDRCFRAKVGPAAADKYIAQRQLIVNAYSLMRDA